MDKATTEAEGPTADDQKSLLNVLSDLEVRAQSHFQDFRKTALYRSYTCLSCPFALDYALGR